MESNQIGPKTLKARRNPPSASAASGASGARPAWQPHLTGATTRPVAWATEGPGFSWRLMAKLEGIDVLFLPQDGLMVNRSKWEII